jgi:hypothetical protein
MDVIIDLFGGEDIIVTSYNVLPVQRDKDNLDEKHKQLIKDEIARKNQLILDVVVINP